MAAIERTGEARHATWTRSDLHAFLVENGMTDGIRIPADGESDTSDPSRAGEHSTASGTSF